MTDETTMVEIGRELAGHTQMLKGLEKGQADMLQQMRMLNGNVRQNQSAIAVLQSKEQDRTDAVAKLREEKEELEDAVHGMEVQIAKFSLLGGGGTALLCKLAEMLLNRLAGP